MASESLSQQVSSRRARGERETPCPHGPGDHQEENRQESERQSRNGTLLISKEAEETDTPTQRRSLRSAGLRGKSHTINSGLHDFNYEKSYRTEG